MTAEVHDIAGARTKIAAPLPVSIEAEQAVIGSLLMHNDLIGSLQSSLQPEHFGEEIHRRIYQTALDLHSMGKPITPGTLKTYVGDQDLGGISTSQYLARLAAEALPALLAPGMAKEVRDVAARRELIILGEDLALRARGAGPATSCVDLASDSLISPSASLRSPSPSTRAATPVSVLPL